MWYINESECFEIDLDRSRLYFTITTFWLLLGVGIDRRWRWGFEFKKVGWRFYQKVRFRFGVIGFEYLNYARRTCRKEVKSQVIYRDMRFWRLFLRKGGKNA
jgi:hypothetical protein